MSMKDVFIVKFSDLPEDLRDLMYETEMWYKGNYIKFSSRIPLSIFDLPRDQFLNNRDPEGKRWSSIESYFEDNVQEHFIYRLIEDNRSYASLDFDLIMVEMT